MKTPTSTEPKEWASFYALGLGWPVLPCHSVVDGHCTCKEFETCAKPGKHPAIAGGVKEATAFGPTIAGWWAKFPFASVGLACGTKFWALDVDGAEGADTLELLLMQHGRLPDTVSAQTGSGGRHYLFRVPDGVVIDNRIRVKPGLDVRGLGGYIVAPPSPHISGRAYEWEADCEPWTAELALAPDWLMAIITGDGVPRTSSAVVSGKFDLERALAGVGKGERDQTIFQLACYCRAEGYLKEIAEDLAVQCAAACNPPFPEQDARKKVEWVWRHYKDGWSDAAKERAAGWVPDHPGPDDITPPPTAPHVSVDEPEQKRYDLTDLGNAWRFRDAAVDTLKWCEDLGTWLAWDGSKWVMDRKGGSFAHQYIECVLNGIREAARSAGEKDKAAWKWYFDSQSSGHISAMKSIAKTLEGMGITTDDLDADPYLLNTPGGMIDLKSGSTLPHDPKRLCTKSTRVSPDTGVSAEEWRQFVFRICAERDELYRYLKSAGGYSLTGSVGEQKLFFCHGSGANGKTTFLEVLLSLLGDYGTTTGTETLLASRTVNPTTEYELARLKAARMVTADETGKGRRLNEERVKILTGGGTITGRFPYGKPFTYRPEFKLWLSSNHKPDIRGTDHGIWRRIRLIPFDVEIPRDEIIQDFDRLLVEREGPGILAWFIAGCADWAKYGLATADSVDSATQLYREEMDTLATFLSECVEFDEDPDVFCETSTLYKVYRAWAERSGESPVSLMRFSLDLKARGFVRDKGSHSRRPGFRGLRPVDAGGAYV